MSNISYEDFIGDTYPVRKQILVTIFSQISPLVKGPNPPKKIMATDSQLDVDAVYLKTFFEQNYPGKAEVIVLNGQTKSDVSTYIKGLEKIKNTYDVFIFVFLTYISPDERIHLKDGMYPMQEFYDDTKELDVMKMKPKIFLIQSDDMRLLSEKFYKKGEEEENKVKIPQDADRLIIMSDIPQQLANIKDTEEKHPSFLIEAFVEALVENSRRPPEHRLDWFSMTTIINNKVQRKIERKKFEEFLNVPLITSTLTKLLKI